MKVDETVLALLWLTLDGDGRAWKSHERLIEAADTPFHRILLMTMYATGGATSETLVFIGPSFVLSPDAALLVVTANEPL